MIDKIKSDTFGKGFLWLLAISLSLMAEGFLTESLSMQASVETAKGLGSLVPEAKASLDKFSEVVGNALQILRSFR